MHIENISLVNFRNYAESHFGFSRDINGILGENGSGKTNLLDAIYYLSLTKSFLFPSDLQSLRYETGFFAIKGQFRRNGDLHDVMCRVKRNEKKEILLEGTPLEKIADHIGNFPVVVVAPNDTDTIRGGSDQRRKFFDGFLSQVSRPYLGELLKYNRALKRRNILLKNFREKGALDNDLLESYDRILLHSGESLFHARLDLMAQFIPAFQESYADLAGTSEIVGIMYLTDFSQPDFHGKFRSMKDQDLKNGRTMTGTHRDEFEFQINGKPIRKFGSQGQQKSFLIAMKLTQFAMISRHKGFKPILLLDDIFDKLDDKRIRKLMQLVNQHEFGQIFITDARPERTLGIINSLDGEKKMIYLDQEGIPIHL